MDGYKVDFREGFGSFLNQYSQLIKENITDKRPFTSILAMVETFTFGTSTFNCSPTFLVDG